MKKYLIIILLLFAFSAYCQSYISGERQSFLDFMIITEGEYYFGNSEYSIDGGSFQLIGESGEVIIDWGDDSVEVYEFIGESDTIDIMHLYIGAGNYNVNMIGSIKTLNITMSKISNIHIIKIENLEIISLADNKLTLIDIYDLMNIWHFNCSNNNLTISNISNILITLDSYGVINGQFDSRFQTPSAPPNEAGQTAKTNLINKGWSVQTD